MATAQINAVSEKESDLQSLASLESVILRGLKIYVEVGRALAAIAEGKLYRWQGYATFEDYCDRRWGMARRTAYKHIDAAEVAENVHTYAQTPPSISQAAELASLPVEQQREVAAKVDFSTATVAEVRQAVQDIRTPTPAAPVVEYAEESESEVAEAFEQVSTESAEAPKSAKMDVHYSSDSPEWYTPPEVVERVVNLLGRIDLDPCSNSGPNPNIPALARFTQADNGLVREWNGSVYMNPPYGRPIVEWVDKLIAEYAAGRTTEAIALVPARVDTDWFRKFRNYAVCFIDGRLKFSGHENSAPFPSAVVYLGGRIDDFAGAFEDMGDIWVRWRWQKV